MGFVKRVLHCGSLSLVISKFFFVTGELLRASFACVCSGGLTWVLYAQSWFVSHMRYCLLSL